MYFIMILSNICKILKDEISSGVFVRTRLFSCHANTPVFMSWIALGWCKGLARRGLALRHAGSEVLTRRAAVHAQLPRRARVVLAWQSLTPGLQLQRFKAQPGLRGISTTGKCVMRTCSCPCQCRLWRRRAVQSLLSGDQEPAAAG